VAVVQLRVPDETKERWVAQAHERGLSLTAYVLVRLDGEDVGEERMREIAREEIESYVRRVNQQRPKEPHAPREAHADTSKPAPVDEPEDEVPPAPPPAPAPARSPSPPERRESGISEYVRRSIR
jgi:hypothetical protein